MKSVTPSENAFSTWGLAVSAEIMTTGVPLIQPFLFIILRTSRPSRSGMTMSSKTSVISLAFFSRISMASLPSFASIISYSSVSRSESTTLFMASSSTIKIFARSLIMVECQFLFSLSYGTVYLNLRKM